MVTKEENEKMMKEFEKFKLAMADILLGALHVESSLEFFISNYFVKPQNSKTFFINDAVFLRMTFEKKIDIFKAICKREGYNMEKVKRIIESIKYVQRTRNKVAHWQTEITFKRKPQLRKRTSFTTRKDILKLEKRILSRFEKERLFSIKGITDLYIKYQKEGTVDEKTHEELMNRDDFIIG